MIPATLWYDIKIKQYTQKLTSLLQIPFAEIEISVSTFYSDGTPFNLVFGMMYCFRQCYFINRKVNDFIKCLYICVMDRIDTHLHTKFIYF